jgi:hypothetical protein
MTRHRLRALLPTHANGGVARCGWTKAWLQPVAFGYIAERFLHIDAATKHNTGYDVYTMFHPNGRVIQWHTRDKRCPWWGRFACPHRCDKFSLMHSSRSHDIDIVYRYILVTIWIHAPILSTFSFNVMPLALWQWLLCVWLELLSMVWIPMKNQTAP